METCDWARELKLCSKLLALDERNCMYCMRHDVVVHLPLRAVHCWNYRRYAARMAKATLPQEFQFTTEKIGHNFSNYSAWHQRSALLPLIYGMLASICVLNERSITADDDKGLKAALNKGFCILHLQF
jgi:geranylgeranyl transferase type-2 subunit alpha